MSVQEILSIGILYPVAASQLDKAYASAISMKLLYGMQEVGGSSPPGSTIALIRIQLNRLDVVRRAASPHQSNVPNPGRNGNEHIRREPGRRRILCVEPMGGREQGVVRIR
jgi:hypothetical protein